jgi:hypothetical protein
VVPGADDVGLVLGEQVGAHLEPRTNPEPDSLTFHRCAISVAYRSFVTG